MYLIAKNMRKNIVERLHNFDLSNATLTEYFYHIFLPACITLVIPSQNLIKVQLI